MDDENGRVGFVRRWVVPVLAILVAIAAFWFVGRMSTASLGPDSEMPPDHFEVACWACHRSEAGFDAMSLLE